jgi:CubicO group peptidase (beta-lactamase class C family)
VPEFTVADRDAAEQVTVRQLLSHTGGFAGDVFDDHGRGDETIARYVEALADQAQLYPPGQFFSYCNSGYSVLGRLIERVREQPSWDAALHKHLLGPLGVSHSVTLAEQAIMFRAAVGHVSKGDLADQQVAPFWQLTRSNSPAGSTFCATARDLVSFARMHLHGGLAQDGTTRILSPESVAAMQQPQITVPERSGSGRGGWGLGWELFDWSGTTVIGHDGGTYGQTSRLRVLPGRGIVLAVLTNGGAPRLLFDALTQRVFGGVAGLDVPSPAVPPRPAVTVDRHRFVGTYENISERIEIVGSQDGGFEAVLTPLGSSVDLFGDAPEREKLVGFDASTLITAEPGPEDGSHSLFAFPDADSDGRAAYVRCDARAHMRIAD